MKIVIANTLGHARNSALSSRPSPPMKAVWERQGSRYYSVEISARLILFVQKGRYALWHYALVDQRTGEDYLRGPPEESESATTLKGVRKAALKAFADWVAEERKHIEELEKWLTK